MVEIRPWLFVGGLDDSRNPRTLAQNGIGAVLQLAVRVEPKGIATRFLPLLDGEIFDELPLREGVDFVTQQREAGKKVLIGCRYGISRSTSFAIAALKEAEQRTLLDAAREVRRAHPEGLPHVVLWNSLCNYYGEPQPYINLVRL